jgi:hypothetical protein
LVREGVDAVLAQDAWAARTQRFLAAACMVQGEAADLALRHEDTYLAEGDGTMTDETAAP